VVANKRKTYIHINTVKSDKKTKYSEQVCHSVGTITTAETTKQQQQQQYQQQQRQQQR